MRQAASAWERDYSDKLTEIGFAKGIAALTVFYWGREVFDVWCMETILHSVGNELTDCGSKAKWKSLMN